MKTIFATHTSYLLQNINSHMSKNCTQAMLFCVYLCWFTFQQMFIVLRVSTRFCCLSLVLIFSCTSASRLNTQQFLY